MKSGVKMFKQILEESTRSTKDSGNIIGDSMKDILPRVNILNSTPSIKKEELVDKLFEYFCFNTKDGTYIYNLTRMKSAFHVGTMTLDDFEEIDEEFIYELADFILEVVPRN